MIGRAAASVEASTPLDIVTALAASCLRVPIPVVEPDVPLARLGLDSLGCLDLAAGIEDALGRRVPADAIVESATVRSLCDALELGDAAADDGLVRMRADAVLPDDVRPARRVGHGTDLRRSRAILLTGATGFLGAALLRELLRQTEARIICVARSTREPAVRRVERLTDALSIDPARIETIDGDLALGAAGLDEAWGSLVDRVDAICHAGASINWVTPYGGLRNVNVLATRDLLRLACEAGAAFHFVSSLSVCYATNGPTRVDERFQAAHSLDGLHFGYAQSKAVAEALVVQARRRGLRTRIYRPAIISGDSVTARFNPDDLLSMLIAGCVRMKTVPDLDWTLDALPVDCVADAIVRLSGAGASTLHLAHPRPRHWREVALWMRLYGYDVRLVAYQDWTEQLRHEAATDVTHPLRALRSFFLDRPREGLSIPELHENRRRPHTVAAKSLRLLSRAGGHVVPLDAGLMDRYFDAFVRERRLPAARTAHGPRRNGHATPDALARDLLEEAGLAARTVTVRASGFEHSIISELTAWRSGSCHGIFHVNADGRDLVLKIKPHARDAVAVGQSLADLCGAPLGSAYERWGSALGIEEGHAREIAVYRDTDPRIREYLPEVFATRVDEPSGVWALLLERVPDTPSRWFPSHVDAAIDGLTDLHARWCGRTDDLLGHPWIGRVRRTQDLIEMRPLWETLVNHAAPLFVACAGAAVPELARDFIVGAADWRPDADALPQTLIHNDFNSRNIRLRRRQGQWTLCAFDWELATIGAPTRDLAELLCFVCPANATPRQVDAWIERHRAALSLRTGSLIDPIRWRDGLAAALRELLIDRLAVYALVHRVKPQPFLPRVLRTWLRLFRMLGDAISA